MRGIAPLSWMAGFVAVFVVAICLLTARQSARPPVVVSSYPQERLRGEAVADSERASPRALRTAARVPDATTLAILQASGVRAASDGIAVASAQVSWLAELPDAATAALVAGAAAGDAVLSATDAAGAARHGEAAGEVEALTATPDAAGTRAADAERTPAASPRGGAATPAPGVGIRGRVTDGARRPVGDARVILWSADDGWRGQETVIEETVSALDGTYQLTQAPLGALVRVEARHGRYAGASRGPFLIDRLDGMSGVDLVLEGGGALAGFVLDGDGRGVARAVVEARPAGAWGGNGTARTAKTEADGEGYYELLNLPLGEYEAQAEAAGYAAQRKLAVVREVGAFEPLDFELGAGGVIAGVVVGDQGRALSNALVIVWGSRYEQRTTTDGAGGFRFASVPEGQYRLRAEHTDYAPAVVDNLAAGRQGVRVVLPRKGTLIVRVESAGGRPLPEATVRFTPAFDEMLAVPAVEQTRGGERVFQLAPGVYTVAATAKGHERKEVAARVAPGQQSAPPLVIRLEAGAGLEGRVVDRARGGGVAGALVAWYAARPFAGGDAGGMPSFPSFGAPGGVTTSDGDGWFAFDAVPDYEVTVMAQHGGYAAALELVAAPNLRSLTLAMSPGAALTGNVSHRGAPFTDAVVEVYPIPAVGAPVAPTWKTATGPDGGFRVDGLPEGVFGVHIKRVYYGEPLWRWYRVAMSARGTSLDCRLPAGELLVEARAAADGPLLDQMEIIVVPIDVTSYPAGPAFYRSGRPDAGGAYRFVCLPEGRYAVTAEGPGGSAREDVLIGSGGAMTQRVTLIVR